MPQFGLPVPARTALALAGAAALVGLLIGPVAAEPMKIGAAVAVVPAATAESEGTQETLQVGTSVHADDLVKTGAQGRTSLEFLDNARFEVGPNSSAKLDKFVFNPDQTAQEAALSLTKGVFRFVSGGRSQHGSYTLSTPHATLGIRGTDLVVLVTDTETVVTVTEGEVEGCARQGTACLTMTPGADSSGKFTRDGKAERAEQIIPAGGPANSPGSSDDNASRAASTTPPTTLPIDAGGGGRINADNGRSSSNTTQSTLLSVPGGGATSTVNCSSTTTGIATTNCTTGLNGQ